MCHHGIITLTPVCRLPPQVRAFGDASAGEKATSQFKCLEPADIARAMLWCLSAPEHVEINDIVVRPREQLL